MKLIGPFKQLLTMDHLPRKGKLNDEQLEILEDAGILTDEGIILKTGPYAQLEDEAQRLGYEFDFIREEAVAMPGMIDVHTHLCFGGSRAADYAMRNAGKTYLEIAGQGGGIWSTVTRTRQASNEMLMHGLLKRLEIIQNEGVTTVEVKSGYGLSLHDEIRLLDLIGQADTLLPVDVVPTCLAAHMKPRDFEGDNRQYLEMIVTQLLPVLQDRDLCHRVDIFVDQGAFSPEEGDYFAARAREAGFQVTIHADQFTPGGSRIACTHGAVSADHLEASGEEEINLLAASDTVAVCLPGASLGLGMHFAPARKLLDAGAAVAIASDWNPGSAPMGDLLLQAAVLGAAEHLTSAETLAAITVRAAQAMHLFDRGRITTELLADVIAFPAADFREILYRQGRLRPNHIWKKGVKIK